jgi:hypothetical protein
LPIGNTFAAPTIAQATWVFDGKGTATFVGENFATIFPGGSPAPAQERVNPIGSQATPFHFVYSITGKGWITGTVTEVPAYAEGYSTGDVGNLTLEGRVSEDHKIITLSNGNQIQFPGTASCAVCNVVRILYKVHD